MLTPIEDLGFSHDVEQEDGEWDGLEKVHAKFTAQWYVDPNDPERGWNVERPEYVLREREVFLDGVCSAIKERDGDEWLIRLYGPGHLPPARIKHPKLNFLSVEFAEIDCSNYLHPN